MWPLKKKIVCFHHFCKTSMEPNRDCAAGQLVETMVCCKCGYEEVKKSLAELLVGP